MWYINQADVSDSASYPGVAKFGIALEWGSRGPEFESQHSDQLEQTLCVCSNFLRVERTHFVAPPFQITTAVPGCDLVPPLRGVFRA